MHVIRFFLKVVRHVIVSLLRSLIEFALYIINLEFDAFVVLSRPDIHGPAARFDHAPGLLALLLFLVLERPVGARPHLHLVLLLLADDLTRLHLVVQLALHIFKFAVEVILHMLFSLGGLHHFFLIFTNNVLSFGCSLFLLFHLLLFKLLLA